MKDIILEGVDVPHLYRQKWALLKIAEHASDKDNGTDNTDADKIEGLICMLDEMTDRLDPDDSIRQAMPETIALNSDTVKDGCIIDF